MMLAQDDVPLPTLRFFSHHHPPLPPVSPSPLLQLRAFNTPFQLGRAPDSGEAPDPRFETPHDASIVRVPVRLGDVLVLATDGLFDNMSEDDLLDVMEAASFDASPQVHPGRPSLPFPPQHPFCNMLIAISSC